MEPNGNDQRRKEQQESPPQVAVVMVPLPVHGHLNQLLHLSRRISAHNIPVYYVATPTHIRQAKLRAHDPDLDPDPNPSPTSNLLHFHELPSIPFENPPPDPNSSCKFPSQIVPSLTASTHLRKPVREFVNGLSGLFRRVVVIHDSLMSYVVQDIDSVLNAVCYTFVSISAVAVCSWDEIEDLPTEAEIVLRETPSMDSYYPDKFRDFLTLQTSAKKISRGEIYNSSREIEAMFLDLLAKRKKKEKVWAIGPFNPVSSRNPHQNRGLCFNWLDKHGPNSVILVSFGTTSSFSDEQIEEIALGLERSDQSFIWVLRDADKGDIFAGEIRESSLPCNFEERVRGRGLVVRDWAPQMEILGHPATGGFVSHCGWNSCLESITMGVPMAAWPLHSDQPANAVLVTKVLGIGVEMKKWRRGEELVRASRVEEVVRRLMGSEEGDEVRRRAAELGEAVKGSWVEGGGAGWREMEAFIAHISTS